MAAPPAPRAASPLVEELKHAYLRKLYDVVARFPEVATGNDKYLALAHAVRDRLVQHAIATGEAYWRERSRTVCYLSAEFLLGPHLGNALLCLGLADAARQAMAELGEDLDDMLAEEEEPGLGNGGLGRLAACYMDSLATLRLPAIGYCIRYEFGMFDQEIRDGWQVERTDKWLAKGNPWEIPRAEITFPVGLGGRTEWYTDDEGRRRVRWIPARLVRGVAQDTFIPGLGVANANMLRLFRAEACESFDFQAFNQGDYWRAVEEKSASEHLTKVLYPNDEQLQGKRLRLEQQYLLVSCALQDMVRIHRQTASDLSTFHEKYAVQLNDTHPSVAVAELQRILVDEHGMAWEPAWEIVRRTFAYTNHTLMPEALESWPLALFGEVLPRHLELVYEINRRFLDDVRARRPGDEDLVRRISIVDEGGGRRIRMAHLACVGSHTVNGVSALHSRLLGESVLRDFHALWPERFRNVTNGVTPRRFLALVNPALAALVTEALGSDAWLRDLSLLRGLEARAEDAGFRARWREVKLANKQALARTLQERTGVRIEPAALLDVQVKRIHEYKRQLLAALHAIALWQRLRRDPGAAPPRTVLLAGKAAPAYRTAKLVIRLVHGIAEVVNADPATRGRLTVAFFPDYNVKNAGWILPAADLSEQISTAGTEASGTGNMKLMMNGALTIGTLDGANVEIREEVGADAFFLFGLRAPEVARLQREGYRPRAVAERDPELAAALDAIAAGTFSRGDRALLAPLVEGLLAADPFLVLADFRSYLDAQREVERAFLDPDCWTRLSIRQVARSGRFSSDRAVAEYARDVWELAPVDVSLEGIEPP
jgi:starch phosphorylase